MSFNEARPIGRDRPRLGGQAPRLGGASMRPGTVGRDRPAGTARRHDRGWPASYPGIGTGALAVARRLP